MLADRGYDSLTNHKSLFGLGIIPVIHIRKPTAKDGLYDGIYTESGGAACMGGEAMKYVRTDPETGAHLFRCPAEGCPLKTQGPRRRLIAIPRSGRTRRATRGSSGRSPGSQQHGSASTTSV